MGVPQPAAAAAAVSGAESGGGQGEGPGEGCRGWAEEVWGASGAPGAGSTVCLVGLDGVGILGRDGGGLGVAAQLSGAGGGGGLGELYERLTNPAVVGLRAVLARSGRGDARFGVWARRRGLVRYRSAVRGEELTLRWRPEWHLG